MSEQSPWGQAPPPSNPPGYGTPYQQGYGQGQGYGGQGGPGGPQGPGFPPPGYGPQGPQGPRKRTGLVVGIVAAVVVLIAALTATVVVVARGGGEETVTDDPSQTTDPTDSTTGSPTESTTESTAPSPDPTTPTTSDPPSPDPGDPTDLPVDASTITGTGYQYQLPGGEWQKANRRDIRSLGAGSSGIDSAAVNGPSFAFGQANLLVEHGPAFGITDVEDLQESWQRNISASVNAEPKVLRDTTIDGEPAVGVRLRSTNDAGVALAQYAYLAVHDEEYISVILTQQISAPSFTGDFETALASWRWTD